MFKSGELNSKPKLPKWVGFALVGFLSLFVVIFVVVMSHMANTSRPISNESGKGQDVSTLKDEDINLSAFSALPSLSQVEVGQSSLDLVYTKEYQISRVSRGITLEELVKQVESMGDDFELVEPVVVFKGGSTSGLVTFRSKQLLVTYSLSRGLVGVGYKGSESDAREKLGTALEVSDGLSEVRSKGFMEEDGFYQGYKMFVKRGYQIAK